MAVRMRLHATTLIVILVVSMPFSAASAAETWTCWSEPASRDDDGGTYVTRCRLAGSTETSDYGSSSDVPVVLSPQVGTDGEGLCWYWTSRSSDWVLLGVDDDGVATLGIDPDGEAGGTVITDAAYPRCVSEPAEAPTTLMEAYELLSQYAHPDPAAVLDPPPGAGVVGMEVFVSESPPPPWSASLVSPHSGVRIEVETYVEAVEIDWGDGDVVVVPQEAFGLLIGWPGGAFGHVYSTKTCEIPGGPRCHPSLSAYELTVSYRWVAQYRVDGGAWIAIGVPSTETIVDYDVDEILSVTTAVG
ncbi:MAG: hypothetical protein WD020_07130 [Acidimicrobiia bacterium]